MGYALTRPDGRSVLGVVAQGGQRMLALLMMVTMLVVSLHHLTCFNDTDGDQGPASISASADPLSTTTKGEPCLPGHCHCVCHVSPQRVADAVSRPADFSSQRYGLLKAEHIHSLAGLPPFKPPRV
jgi:hypothetical protein